MTRYRANGPRFVDETVDGEALIMDMVKGAYYTCLGPAAVAWDALKRGFEPSEITAMVASTYQVTPADVDRDLAGFVDELLREEMLVVRDDSSPRTCRRRSMAPAPAHRQAPTRRCPSSATRTSPT